MMTDNAVRQGFHTVTPYLRIAEALKLVEFLKQAFDAKETLCTTGSQGGVHAEVLIGDSMVMIGGIRNGESYPTTLYLYLPNIDLVYKHALQVGATSIDEPADQPDGDRRAGFKDPFGNIWYIATNLHDLPV